MPTQKREAWTEADLDNLPSGEQDYFERKSGLGYEQDVNDFLNAVAKAASAFLNSGGGHLILGITDDGVPDGLPSMNKRTPIKDWLEQKMPALLEYPPSDFRVHCVVRYAENSRISDQKEVVVIDFGDSVHAPHQRKSDKVYFYRAGGRSERAPHFYLDLLRQRFTEAKLIAKMEKAEISSVCEDDGLFIAAKLNFIIENVGNVAAYKWQLRPVHHTFPDGVNGPEDILFESHKFPNRVGGLTSIRMDNTYTSRVRS